MAGIAAPHPDRDRPLRAIRRLLRDADRDLQGQRAAICGLLGMGDAIVSALLAVLVISARPLLGDDLPALGSSLTGTLHAIPDMAASLGELARVL